MGEAKRKEQTRRNLLDGAACIYCGEPATTIEHMPPRAMFDGKYRPKGMEFPACYECNNGTSTADLVAAFVARLDMSTPEEKWHSAEYKQRLRAIRNRAPAVVDEIVGPCRSRETLIRSSGGVLQKAVEVHANGPHLQSYLTVFAAKMAMALYAEHVGAPLPKSGGVEVWFYLNAGLSNDAATKLQTILPGYGTLTQGTFTVPEQFAYKFNSDGKGLLAALMSFHRGLFVFTFAAAEPAKWRLPTGDARGHFVRPGELYGRTPQKVRRITIAGTG
ncbi:MAG: hypothetical protein ABI216_08085 [Devosia sp.]